MRIGRAMRSGRVRGMHSRDYGRDMRRGGRDYGRMADYGRNAEYRTEFTDLPHSMPAYERDRGYGERPYEWNRDYGNVRRVGNFEYDTYYGGDIDRDYGYDGERLTNRELKEWARDLLDEIKSEHRAMFDKANFEKRAIEMGFESKEYSLDELYVATLMAETDYGDTMKKYGINNLDTTICLAKDFLEDPDSDLRYGEKLASYYYNVVCIDG